MTSQLIQLTYLVSSICFIMALRGLSAPKSARLGNITGIIGMAVALIVTFCLPGFRHKIPLLIAILTGGMVGGLLAKKIAMTALPQLVAGFHSLVGLAATFVAYCAILAPENFAIGITNHLPVQALVEISLGVSIGALTFSGSIIAFAKLQGLISAAPIKFTGQPYFCLALSGLLIGFMVLFINTQSITIFNLIVLFSLLLGVLLIIPIGGADMPVVVSMLNSYSGWAAAGIGFTLSNSLLIITGALVGSSGAILSYIMCRAMNRSLLKVTLGAFIHTSKEAVTNQDADKVLKVSSPEDTAYMLKSAHTVIIVPGYGMAVAQSQHAVKELVALLEGLAVNVRFAIHPVAGRMPGHMNVLLAEAGIDYQQVLELEEINRDFKNTDIVLVLGANDITNPAAKNDPTSPIFGMPVLDVEQAKMVLFVKRSTAAGYAGISNELFYRNNTLMLFGDAKKVVEDIIKHLNEN